MSPISDATTLQRRGITVYGLVQGVGYRPFVYRLAMDEGLAGWVRNNGSGVEIEVEGLPDRIASFVARLSREAPPLARVERVGVTALRPVRERVFRIISSTRMQAGELLPVSADVAPCEACLREVQDPGARRYRYPFTNCTNCGPRFTIIEELPYDRDRTTMRDFRLCPACRAEYADPADRRFHAEPIACPDCGPALELRHAGSRLTGDGALLAAADLLRAGGIVALKGLGGFQLACDAGSTGAVTRLRERKAREAKPFAVMVRDLEAARTLCRLDDVEAAVLSGPRAPIVLLGLRDPAPMSIALEVAPGLDMLGLMLPSTPLHHLLLAAFSGPLVMTSGNRSESPIAIANDEALERLDGIADAVLLHDRKIASRYDDSVVRVDAGREVVLRRARGYAPDPVRLPISANTPILATGSHLKNTFCLVRGDLAFPSQHIGDLHDAATLLHYHETIGLYQRLFGIDPTVVAHDLHPDYASTRFALSLEGVQRVGVQHHHAHVVSCLAEHGIRDTAIGVVFDGTGYGTDGAVWGGEILLADWKGFGRIAHLDYLPLPGGDAAAREPWRMAAAALAHAFGSEAEALAATLLPHISSTPRKSVLGIATRAVGSAAFSAFAPPTSSAGRLFDAVAALAGIRHINRYEGQAAMELEAGIDPSESAAYPLPLRFPERKSRDGRSEPAILGSRPLIRAVVDDVRRGASRGAIAARFHNALASAVARACVWKRESGGPNLVVLSGGCFQNRRLLEKCRAELERAGFRVLSHRRIPPNDGGISLGQAGVALASFAP